MNRVFKDIQCKFFTNIFILIVNVNKFQYKEDIERLKEEKVGKER